MMVAAPRDLHTLDQPVDREGGVAHQLFLAEGGGRHVDRQQVVEAADLVAVAGEEEERHVARLDHSVERGERLVHGALADILAGDDLEAEPLERLAHGFGVADGLLQWRHVLVSVVADDQGDALGCERNICEQAGRQGHD